MSEPTTASPRGLWINPAVGVAGDMIVAALIDAGADVDAVRALVTAVGLPEWDLSAAPTTRRGLTATALTVTAPDDDHHRSWSTIDRMLVEADLPTPVRDGARRTFGRLARAEADVHGIDVDDVVFHEVGAVDAVVDVVAAWAAVFDLGLPTVASGPVGLGVGTVEMAHGTVAVPAPATLELLRGHPTVPVDADGETATPTGAALLSAMATSWGPLPAGTITAVGRGAGTWDPVGHANVLTVVRFDPAPGRSSTGPTGDDGSGRDLAATVVDAVVVETTVDDVTPELLGHVLDAALEIGADDAWILPVTMKKSRPGHQVRVLCRPAFVGSVRRLLASETGTLGIREWRVTKSELDRRIDEVAVDGCPIRIKVGPFGAKPEHDDVVAAAVRSARPVRDVAADAMALYRDRS